MVSSARGIEASKSNLLGDRLIGQNHDCTRGWASNIMPRERPPQNGGCTVSAPALDLTASLRGDSPRKTGRKTTTKSPAPAVPTKHIILFSRCGVRRAPPPPPLGWGLEANPLGGNRNRTTIPGTALVQGRGPGGPMKAAPQPGTPAPHPRRHRQCHSGAP